MCVYCIRPLAVFNQEFSSTGTSTHPPRSTFTRLSASLLYCSAVKLGHSTVHMFASLKHFTSGVFRLQRILGLAWADRIPHVEILQRTGCFSIEALITKRQLRWIGHVIRMPENRLPRKLFYGELSSGYRSSGGQRKRYKDHLHSVLKQCSIPAPELESLAACRSTWRSTCHDAVVSFEARRTEARQLQRQNRHLRQAGVHPPPGTGVTVTLSGLQPSLRLRLRTAQSHAGTQPHIRSWGRHRRHRRTTTTI